MLYFLSLKFQVKCGINRLSDFFPKILNRYYTHIVYLIYLYKDDYHIILINTRVRRYFEIKTIIVSQIKFDIRYNLLEYNTDHFVL